MLKQVSPVYQNFTAGVMTGTNTITSAVTNVLYRDDVSIQLQWTGSPVGSFQIQGCLDYHPQVVQGDGAGAPNTGTWTTLTVTNSNTGISGTTFSTAVGSPILLNLNLIGFPWIQVVYTNASGSGTLTGYITAKSLG